MAADGGAGDAMSGVVAKVEEYPCTACPLRPLDGLCPPDARQSATLQAIKQGERVLDRGDVLLQQGEVSTRLFTVLEGVLIRYRLLEDGRRQILNFSFPGDLIGMQGAFDAPLSHSVEAMLPSRVCEFQRADFPTLIAAHPRLGYDLIWIAAKEEADLEEHLVSLGRRSARERIASLAVWLVDRARSRGLARDGNSVALPITQAQIADMLGLSLVHVNRSLQSLRRDGLLEWTQSEVTVNDFDAAARFAGFQHFRTRRAPYI